jgi:acidic leucine-rich nuclear phosphoprotein 32 family protein A/C/D
MDLQSAIDQKIGSTPPEEVKELLLDGCKATKVTGLEKFSSLTTLTLNGCGLTTLEDFPTLQHLKKLELADNQLADGCLDELQNAGLFLLTKLSLAGNRFGSLDALEPLQSLPMLRDLDLFNCPVTEVDDYRRGIFDMLPELRYLDGFDAYAPRTCTRAHARRRARARGNA